ncbi:MAG: AIR synthase-related protein [Promethearchaeota archaeon]
MSLPKGKLSLAKLEQLVFCHIPRVTDARKIALDFSVAPSSNQLVAASDPVIGIPLPFYGFFAVHYSAADVAMAGATPQYLMLGVYYPPGTPESWLEATMKQLGEEARRLKIGILGGHTGGYDGLTLPFLSITCLGFLPQGYKQPEQVKVGDALLAVGPIGRETLWFLANVEPSQIGNNLKQSEVKSVAQDLSYFEVAPLIARIPRQNIKIMHDLAEGGLATGLAELQQATGLGITIQYDKIPWDDKAIRIFSHLKWNPLHCSSFGSLLCVTDSNTAVQTVERFHSLGRPAAIIGNFVETQEIFIQRKDKRTPLKVGKDPYQKLTSRIS